MSQQLTFDWPVGVSLGQEDFFVTDANAQAYDMVLAPQTWPDGKLVLQGPAGCGKRHLARIFQTQHKAAWFDAAALTPDMRPDAPSVVLAGMDHLPSNSEEVVFHLHNRLQATGGFLLMTARMPPIRWPIALPDLASRMQATSIAQITEPDDALLTALMMKLFADRQIMPPPALMSYLATRIERSFAAAADIVNRLDEAALREGRPINRALAMRLLDNS